MPRRGELRLCTVLMSIRSLIVVAVAGGAVGCTQPVMRSMRIEKGFELAAGAEVLVGGEDAESRSAGNEGGTQEPSKSAAVIWPFNVDARYGFVDDSGLGIAGGLYAPGAFNQKITGSASGCPPPLWLFVPYVQLGAMTGPVSTSLGGEGGCGAGALFGGFDFRLADPENWGPVSVSPAGRWTTPWGPEADTPIDQVPRGDSLEAGVSLRVSFLFVQYWHEWARGPVRQFEHPGGTVSARTWHTFVLGADVPFNRL
jgi:hypothetical protein